MSKCETEKCDRKQGHPGFHMQRCTRTPYCQDRLGHAKHCSTSRYLDWGFVR